MNSVSVSLLPFLWSHNMIHFKQSNFSASKDSVTHRCLLTSDDCAVACWCLFPSLACLPTKACMHEANLFLWEMFDHYDVWWKHWQTKAWMFATWRTLRLFWCPGVTQCDGLTLPPNWIALRWRYQNFNHLVWFSPAVCVEMSESISVVCFFRCPSCTPFLWIWHSPWFAFNVCWMLWLLCHVFGVWHWKSWNFGKPKPQNS